MINLDEKYHSYLELGKSLKIDGVNEKVRGYGYTCDFFIYTIYLYAFAWHQDSCGTSRLD